MPAAVPVVAAVAGAYAGGAAAFSLGGGSLLAGVLIKGAVGIAVSTAINSVGSRALSSKPKRAEVSSVASDAAGRTASVRSSIESHKIIYGQAKVSGPIVFVQTVNQGYASNGDFKNNDNRFLHLVIALAGHQVEEIGDIYFNDQLVSLDSNGFATTFPYKRPDGPGYSYARVKKFTGSPDQIASPELIAEIPGWTAAHRLRGIAYIHVRFEFQQDVFPVGIPNVTAIVKGKRVFDPRTGTTRWTSNAALCIRDYLSSDYGFACQPSEINDGHFIAAANICDEGVAVSNGFIARYACDGVIDTAAAPLENLQSLVTALAGAVTYVQGRFRVHAAAYDSPAGNIGIDMLAGPVEISARPGRKELFNAVKGTYVNPSQNWQPVDFPPVTNARYEAEDNGERIVKDIELPFTTDGRAAQRIGKILLEKGRQGITVTIPVNHSCLKYAVYDVVTLTNPQMGWDAKPFRITGYSIPTPGPIQITLQEESAASYAWNNGEASAVDAAPDTTLPSAFNVSPPGALTVSEEKYVTRAGDGVKVRVNIAWVESADVFVRQYQPEYKPRASEAWSILPRTTETNASVDDIAPGDYDLRVKALNGLGVSSAYSTGTLQVSGLLDPPINPQNLTISTIGGLAILRWDEYLGNVNLDVKIGGKIVFRHSPDETAGWAQSTTIGNAVPGSSTTSVLPLKPGIYLAKAVDSSGIESLAASTVVTEQATALAYANVTSLVEQPGFSGIRTDTTVDDAFNLRLAGSGTIDELADFDAETDIDGYSGISQAGSYAFSGVMDLGSVKRVRLTSHILANIVNQLDMIDSRTGDIDDWLSFESTDVAAADAILYVSTSQDDPSGSPAWKPWQRIDSGEFYERAFRFRLDLSTTDPAYNILISELQVTADEVA